MIVSPVFETVLFVFGLVALGYLVKTLIVGIAWLAIPDLPERAATHVRETWQRLAGAP